MRLLADTCTFIWMSSSPDRLSARARTLLVDPSNEVFLSSVSAWEIAVKYRLGHLQLRETPDRFVLPSREAPGWDALPLDEDSVLQVLRLPALHRDPFDRMLVCQAIVHGLAIVT